MKVVTFVLRLASAGLIAPIATPPQALAAIRNQAWYPDGYLDLREAAASHVKDYPRDPRVVIFDWGDPKLAFYDVIDCNLDYHLPSDMDPYERQVAALALDIARMRYELAELGYNRQVHDGPLLDYERAALEAFAAEGTDRAANPESYVIQNWDLLGALAREMEARRAELNPKRPRIVSEGGCGAGEGEFEIHLIPADGELWLINAFAFRVCERKVADPWNHRACGWTQYQEGDTTFASGRYMYEARWGGTVRRGARVLEADPADGDVTQVTFRP